MPAALPPPPLLPLLTRSVAQLAFDQPPEEIVSIYQEHCRRIFTKSRGRKLSPLHASYSDTNRDEIFRDFAGTATLGEVERWLLITSFRLDGVVDGPPRTTFFPSGRWRPALFTNMPRLHGVVRAQPSPAKPSLAMAELPPLPVARRWSRTWTWSCIMR